MKKIFISTVIFIITFGALPVLASAHPGRTDEKGGHKCHTECEKWGLKYEEYHFHEKKMEARTEARTQARQSF